MSKGQIDTAYSPKLLLGLEALWREQIFVDTTLVFGPYEEIGPYEVKVHRAVLAAASQYFKSMFAGSLKESWCHERIEIHEVNPTVVENLIEYSYTGKIDINQDNVLVLLQTADLLQFDSVRRLCSDFLIAQLCPENCMDMSKLAESLGMWRLLTSSREFCHENIGKVAEVVKDFFKMDFATFEDMLTNRLLKVPKEETVVELIMSWVMYNRDDRQIHLSRLIHQVRLPFLRRFYLLQISHHPVLLNDEVCAKLVHEAKNYHSMKLDRYDYATERRFKPRESTGIFEIFVRIGGTNTDLDELSVVEGYNPISGVWRRLSEPLREPLRGGYSTCGLGPDLYICGGRTSDGMVTNRCFQFKPQLDSWSEINGMLRDREYHCSASLQGYLYCISGDSAEVFDPTTSAWALIPPLPHTCENLQAVGTKGVLYVVASPLDENNDAGNITLYQYDPNEKIWTHNELDPPELWSVCPLMTAMNGRIYFLGDDSKYLQSFDPISKSWSLLANSKEVHLGGSVTVLNGRITISGGYASDSGLTDLIEQYDTVTDSWSEYTRLKEPTFWHGSVSVFRFIQAPMSPDFQSNFFH